MLKRIALSPLAWLGAAAVAAAILLGVFTGATLAFAAVAAVASVAAAGVAWQSTHEQKQMADDLRRLAELTESSIEEARTQRPDPIVRFLTGDGKSVDAMRIERSRLEREIDVETIVEGERQRAMATLPVEPTKKDRAAPAALPGFDGAAEAVRQMEAITRAAGILGAGYNARAPASPEEKAKFEKQVDDYLARVREWLDDYRVWRDETNHLVRFHLRFENLGRVPCQGARIDVHFPDPFEGVEEDDYPGLGSAPTRPHFHRKSPWEMSGLSAAMTGYTPDIGALSRLSFGPEGNVSRPRYRNGSVHVDIRVTKLLHGPHEDSAPITLRAPADGTHPVSWEIWAENLAESARGELQLNIHTRVETGAPITQLDELLSKSADDDADEDS